MIEKLSHNFMSTSSYIKYIVFNTFHKFYIYTFQKNCKSSTYVNVIKVRKIENKKRLHDLL